jgi:hypothetical protein
MPITKSVLIAMIDRATFNNPDFAKSFKKWVPYFCSLANRICAFTGKCEDDVLQDLLIGVAEINCIYDIPLYRYNGRLYERLREDGTLSLLITPRNNKMQRCEMWVETKNIEFLKKGKLESTIYRELTQQLSDILNSHFAQKRGFKKSLDADERQVVRRSGSSGTKLFSKKTYKVSKTIDVCSIKDLESEPIDFFSNPEEDAILGQYVSKMKEKVSPIAGTILDVKLQDPKATWTSVARLIGINPGTAHSAARELARNLPFDTENTLAHDRCVPVHMRAE